MANSELPNPGHIDLQYHRTDDPNEHKNRGRVRGGTIYDQQHRVSTAVSGVTRFPSRSGE